MHISLRLPFVLLITLLIPFHVIAKSNASSLIKWQEWNNAAFAQARLTNKMIIVNVGIEVCYACNWMEEGTYSQPAVAELINKHFIPIQVDANARPDLGERYSDWAWPATIFMDPNGTQVLALRGSRRPPNFIPILEQLIEKKANNQLQADALAPYAAPEKPESSELSLIRDRVRSSLDEDYDDINAGWGDELKEVNGFGRIEQLFFRAVVEADSQSRKRALATASAMTSRMDNVWGGFYSAGEDGWENPITEKRTGAQATAMMTFAAAYKLTQDIRYINAANNIDRYLQQWMLTTDGTFYTSQEGEAKDLPKGVSPADYFKLDDKKRRQLGIPAIDHTVYTDLNARLIKAYVELYEATKNQQYLITARRTATALLKDRLQTQGWISQVEITKAVKNEQRIHLLNATKSPILRAQVEFGIALLALHRATGEKNWLDTAVKLADTTQTLLGDPKLGGFYATVTENTNSGLMRRKPLQDNGVAARFLYQLGRYTKNKTYEQLAEKAIRASVSPTILKREGRIVGNLAVALETLTAQYVEVSVVGQPSDLAATQLFDAAHAYHDPRKIMHYEKPGRYPDLGRAAMYICDPTACSIPVFKPADVLKQASKFTPQSSSN